MAHNLGWTEERTAITRKLWLEGLSAAQIAEGLGGVTRNAVIGKIHRLGLQLSPRPRLTKPSAPRPQRNKLYRKPKFAKVMPMLPSEPAPSLNIPLIELRDFQCHAVTDPTPWEQRYCGQPVMGDGVQYCAPHFKLYRQIKPRAGRAR